MSVGVVELALLLVVTIGMFAAARVTGNRYLLGVVGLFVVAAVFSPADPVSTLLFAVPSSLIYLFAVRRLTRRAAG